MNTTLDALYSALGTVITDVTGRTWWRKGGIQGTPQEPYATVFLTQEASPLHPVVENVDAAEGFTEVPWNESRVSVLIQFYRGEALHDANKFRAALAFASRFYDLWALCGLVSAVDVADVSGAFRMDIENRADIRFAINANLAYIGDAITDIETVAVDVTHVRQDGEESTTTVNVENTEN